MLKRFFKKLMTEENLDNTAAAEQETPGTEMPGVEVPAGAEVPGTNLNQGAPSQPEPGVPTPPEQTSEVPATNDETTPEATPAVDPMQPVDRG